MSKEFGMFLHFIHCLFVYTVYMALPFPFFFKYFSENCMLFFYRIFQYYVKKASEFFEFQKFCNLYVGVNTYKQNVSDNIWLCCCVLWYATETPSFIHDQGSFWWIFTTKTEKTSIFHSFINQIIQQLHQSS